MLTRAQAKIVMLAIDESAHSEKIVFHGPNQYSVTAVDRATGYPFEVYDFEDWTERRRINADFREYMESLDD